MSGGGEHVGDRQVTEILKPGERLSALGGRDRDGISAEAAAEVSKELLAILLESRPRSTQDQPV